MTPSNGMSSESSTGTGFEISGIIPPAEACVAALLDLKDSERFGTYRPINEFFEVFTQLEAPAELTTQLMAHGPDYIDRLFDRDGWTYDPIATVAVGFNDAPEGVEGLHNIHFVRTVEGIRAFKVQFGYNTEGRLTPEPVRELNENELTALTKDANAQRQMVIETDLERLKLGPLVEEMGPNGLRRFHIGDILSVIAPRRIMTARGMEGIYDILSYMTNDEVSSLQLGRFADECEPFLRRQFDGELSSFYDPPEEALADVPSMYRWLSQVAAAIGESLLTVHPIPEESHAIIDAATEMELDYGSDFMRQKVIELDIPDDSQE